jgi:hypothetical protein
VKLPVKYHCFIADGLLKYTTISDGNLYLLGVSLFYEKLKLFTPE